MTQYGILDHNVRLRSRRILIGVDDAFCADDAIHYFDRTDIVFDLDASLYYDVSDFRDIYVFKITYSIPVMRRDSGS